jgi:hypothetical protein
MNLPRRSRPIGSNPLASILEEERALAEISVTPRRAAEVQVRKWEAIRSFLESHPFEVSETLSRADQWRRVGRHLGDVLGEPETLSWVAVQAEIADHIARGIQDLRPRGDGPCHAVLMRWVRGREFKARAVLAWVLEAGESCQIPT